LSARIRRRCESPGTGLASPLKLLPQPAKLSPLSDLLHHRANPNVTHMQAAGTRRPRRRASQGKQRTTEENDQDEQDHAGDRSGDRDPRRSSRFRWPVLPGRSGLRTHQQLRLRRLRRYGSDAYPGRIWRSGHSIQFSARTGMHDLHPVPDAIGWPDGRGAISHSASPMAAIAPSPTTAE